MNCRKSTDGVPPVPPVEMPSLSALSAPMVSLAPNVLSPAPVQTPMQAIALAELGPAGWIVLAGLAAVWIFGGKR